ncbi:MAG: hypothetical protein IIW48_03030 [Clostridia bacterium]|nr:hypothetical protein [Clostridia bacterium]
MKSIIKYYMVTLALTSIAIIGTCAMITVDEKNAAMLFGKETQTIQLSTESIGAELRKIF